jgi:hypothetical protein
VAFDGLHDEPGFQQFALGPVYYVGRLPAALCQVSPAGQQAAVVVSDELPGQLQQQRACGMAQKGIGGAIEY